MENIETEHLCSSKVEDCENANTATEETINLLESLYIPTERQIEREIIEKYIASDIEFVDTKHRGTYHHQERNGSLYELYISEYFDINYLVSHLNKHNEEAIIETLVRVLYEKYSNDAYFYLPQILMLAFSKENSEPLERFLVMCSNSQMKYSLAIYWAINSNISLISSNKKQFEIADRIETCLVNGGKRINKVTKKQLENYREKGPTSSFLTKGEKKGIEIENKVKYFEMCQDFYKELSNMCLQLFDLKEQKVRREALDKYILTFNEKIKLNRPNAERIEQRRNLNLLSESFFFGYLLPMFNDFSNSDENNATIVRIIPDYSFSFSSKARTPVKLCLEIVRVQEFTNWEFLYIEEDDKLRLAKVETNTDELINNFLGSLIDLRTQKPKCESFINLHGTREYSSLADFLSEIESKNLAEVELKRSNFPIEKSPEKKQQKISSTFHPALNNLKKKTTNTSSDSFSSNNSINSDFSASITSDFYKVEDYMTEMVKNPFGEPWSDIVKKIKSTSPYRNFETYSVKSVICKANDDLRQEQMIMQLIRKFNEIFLKENVNIRLKTYDILVTDANSGIIEFLPNTISLDGLKKIVPEGTTLLKFYQSYFKNSFDSAQLNFIESLAGYSLATYLLQIKDRHNGNILIQNDGNLIHIDFGFVLGTNPGGINFEKSPFKLTSEYLNIIGGLNSQGYSHFITIIFNGLKALRKHSEPIIDIIEIMSLDKKIPCFESQNINNIIIGLKERLMFNKTDKEMLEEIKYLAITSLDNFWTNKYDYFQYYQNGVLY